MSEVLAAHAANAAPSRLHSKVAVGSVAVKVNAALAEATTPEGPVAMVVSGACVSTVQVRETGVGSTLPEVSTARMATV